MKRLHSSEYELRKKSIETDVFTNSENHNELNIDFFFSEYKQDFFKKVSWLKLYLPREICGDWMINKSNNE